LDSLVSLPSVVVTAVDELSFPSGETRAKFWVTDPDGGESGLFVIKDVTDLPASYAPVVGDLVSVTGFLQTVSKYEQEEAYRLVLENQSAANPLSGHSPLWVELFANVAPPADLTAPVGFGDAQGGAVMANADLTGARVVVPGPVSLTDARPMAFKRLSAVADDFYYGFAVTGGVLVNTRKTATPGPGVPSCDWAALVKDGGTVTFPHGIAGVWDTYAHAPCVDGGTDPSLCTYVNGVSTSGTEAAFVPGADAGFTLVLYPQNCAVDLAGVGQP
jgi:hypothetical protein